MAAKLLSWCCFLSAPEYRASFTCICSGCHRQEMQCSGENLINSIVGSGRRNNQLLPSAGSETQGMENNEYSQPGNLSL